MPAISRTSVMPPAWHRSGWRIVAAFFSSTSRKPHFVNTRSPVAIGRWVPRAISAIRSWSWQLIGSSMNIGWCGSSALMSIFAWAGLVAPWKSMAMSTLSPAALRNSPNRSAAIEGMAINRLPMMDHLARVLANQVRLNLFDRGGTREGSTFRDWFAETDDASIGVDLEEQPARLDQERLQFGDLHGGARRDGR